MAPISACKPRRRHSRLAWRIRHLSHIPDGPPDRLSCHSSTRDEWWFSIVEFVADAERPPLLVTRDPAGKPSVLHSPIALLRAPRSLTIELSIVPRCTAYLVRMESARRAEPGDHRLGRALLQSLRRLSSSSTAPPQFGGRCGAVLHALQR